jgi:hypothetical protein
MESAGNSVMLRVRSHPLEQTNTMERRMVGGQLEKLGLTFFAGVIIRTVPGSPAARLGKDLIDHVLVAVNGVCEGKPTGLQGSGAAGPNQQLRFMHTVILSRIFPMYTVECLFKNNFRLSFLDWSKGRGVKTNRVPSIVTLLTC